MNDPNICIIPARAGSKRVINKNFRILDNKVVLWYPVNEAKKSGFDRIILSTDLENGELMAQKLGIDYLRRSESNSNDDSTIYDIVEEVLINLGIRKGKVCILYPTAAIVTVDQILKCKELLDRHDSVFPVIKTGIHHEKILTIFGEEVAYKYPQYNLTPSQICSEIYSHSGTFFYCNIEAMLKEGKIIMKNSGHIVLNPWEAVEVDTDDDWKMLEVLFKNKTIVDGGRLAGK